MKTEKIEFRVSPEEKAQIELAANKSGKTIGAFLIDKALTPNLTTQPSPSSLPFPNNTTLNAKAIPPNSRFCPYTSRYIDLSTGKPLV